MANHKNELIQEWVSSAVKCLAEQATNAKVCHQHRVGLHTMGKSASKPTVLECMVKNFKNLDCETCIRFPLTPAE